MPISYPTPKMVLANRPVFLHSGDSCPSVELPIVDLAWSIPSVGELLDVHLAFAAVIRNESARNPDRVSLASGLARESFELGGP